MLIRKGLIWFRHLSVLGEVILVIEDDDYYAPNYIEVMYKLLETSEIAGISNSRYYHMQVPGYRE